MADRKPTFADQVRSARSTANAQLFRTAAAANAIAKITCGRNRRIAYRVKNRCLDQLITRGRVLVKPDNDRYPGLLSVCLSPQMRLHTHEGWLRECRWRVA
jgi:hypothetical protein